MQSRQVAAKAIAVRCACCLVAQVTLPAAALQMLLPQNVKLQLCVAERMCKTDAFSDSNETGEACLPGTRQVSQTTACARARPLRCDLLRPQHIAVRLAERLTR